MSKVDIGVAEDEIKSWLEKKKVFKSTIEVNQDNIDLLAEAMSDGDLTLAEDGEFNYKLRLPFGSEVKIEKLTFKSRLNDKMLRPYLQGLKPNDGDGRTLGYLCCLTGQNKAVLEQMDSIDKKVAMAITIFFL